MIGVVLAGGLSSRMGGGDKSLLSLDGRTLLERSIERLKPQVDAVVLNANGDGSRFETDVSIVADSIQGYAGPLAGVLAGMDYAASIGAKDVVTVAADTPFFPSDLVQKLSSERQDLPLSMAHSPNGRHPTFGLWSVALREDLRAALQDGLRKVVLWTAAKGCAKVMFSDQPFDPFFNVNTPEDLEHAQAMVQEYNL